jgi:predicted AAA+ superfamily ATPase
MFRAAMTQLVAWRDSSRRKPLILQGARQVGKTWLLKQFGEQYFEDVAYANFEETPSVAGLFEGDFDAERVFSGLRAITGARVKAGQTLIVLDEIQACPAALTSLKYFAERTPEYHIATAGSLLGVVLHGGTSFPVGKVNYIDLWPLTFTEFAQAVGNETKLEPLLNGQWSVVAALHQQYTALLRDYLFVGGMPEVVATFARDSDYATARVVQQEILRTYDADFSKHAPAEQVPRIRAVWNSVPEQLARENKRFSYAKIAEGARGRQYELALQWLEQTGLVYAVNRITTPRLPLPAYRESEVFKLYALDVGLLGALSDLDAKSVVEGNRLFTEFKGSLTENFVAQSLVAATGKTPAYWAAGSGAAEVDFVIAQHGEITPVEVKAERNLRAKSLISYIKRYSPKVALRMSLSQYSKGESVLDLPLYAADLIPTFLGS